jgi:aspartate aminotransferase
VGIAIDPGMIQLSADFGSAETARALSCMAQAMQASSILTIANEIRAKKAAGERVVNLTVGDFDPKLFPIPEGLSERLKAAIDAGDTNYPPPAGTPEMRAAVQAHIKRTQNLELPIESIAIVGGGRPTLYAAYRLLVEPGELVVFPVPSWNNHNYRDVCQVRVKEVACRAEDAFQPTATLLRPHLREARMFVLNTPQNPSGGVMPKEDVAAFGHLLVEENERRSAAGEKPLFLLFDQIYRSITFDDYVHYSPVQLVPECAPYVLHSDGLSKNFCATGLRCGWVFGPPALIKKITALLTHVGAWAPKPVQAAAAGWLSDFEAVEHWEGRLKVSAKESLQVLADGIAGLQADGLPVEMIRPQGAIYLSVRFNLVGRRTPSGEVLEDNEAVRAYLLSESGFAIVPFQAFGAEEADAQGWSRASVGAASARELRDAMPGLRRAIEALT